MSTITNAQITKIQTILGKTPRLKEMKDDIISGASNGRTTSVKDLTMAEARMLITGLNNQQPAQSRTVDTNDPRFKMRGKIMAMAHELGWHQKDANGKPVIVNGKMKLDYERLNNWCIQYGYLHKKLDDYSYKELPSMITQFQKVYKDYLKGI